MKPTKEQLEQARIIDNKLDELEKRAQEMRKTMEQYKPLGFYRGDKENPFDGWLGTYWTLEKWYMTQPKRIYEFYLDDFKRLNVKDAADIPHELMLCLFAYWRKSIYDLNKEDVALFYKFVDKYRKARDDWHRPLDIVATNYEF